jgi:hypothetical protein
VSLRQRQEIQEVLPPERNLSRAPAQPTTCQRKFRHANTVRETARLPAAS